VGVLLTTTAIVIAVAVGVWSEGRWPAAAAHAARQALTVMLYVLLPVVIFFNLAAANLDLTHSLGLVLALIAASLGAGFAWIVSRRYLHLPKHQAGAVVSCVLAVNTGYLGYPLTVALLGHGQLTNAVLYDVLVTDPCLLLGAFAIGAAFGTHSGETPRQRVRAFFTRNPPMYAAVAGLLAPSALAPSFLVDASQVLVVAILPIGFFAVGATLAEGTEGGGLPFPPALTKPVMVTLFSRLLMVPALLMIFSAPFIDLPPAYRLMSVMPTGLNAMIVSHAYGLDNKIVAEAITWSTALVVMAALVSLAF
jgi:predicted permease